MGFLREEFKQKAIDGLKKLGCPDHIIEKVIEIPEGEHDNHRHAHAIICEENALYHEERNELFLMLSTIMLMAIQEEAEARDMTSNDFPLSHNFMRRVVIDQSGVDINQQENRTIN